MSTIKTKTFKRARNCSFFLMILLMGTAVILASRPQPEVKEFGKYFCFLSILFSLLTLIFHVKYDRRITHDE